LTFLQSVAERTVYILVESPTSAQCKKLYQTLIEYSQFLQIYTSLIVHKLSSWSFV